MHPEHAHPGDGVTLEAVPSGREPDEKIVSQEAMIAGMRRYRNLKRLQESQERHATECLKQVEAEIEEDMRPLEQAIERVRRSMLAYLTEHNGGRKFRVPDLGTAFTRSRLRIELADEEAFAASLHDHQREQGETLNVRLAGESRDS